MVKMIGMQSSFAGTLKTAFSHIAQCFEPQEQQASWVEQKLYDYFEARVRAREKRLVARCTEVFRGISSDCCGDNPSITDENWSNIKELVLDSKLPFEIRKEVIEAFAGIAGEGKKFTNISKHGLSSGQEKERKEMLLMLQKDVELTVSRTAERALLESYGIKFEEPRSML